MIRVTVMTDGFMEADTEEVLVEIVRPAAEARTKKNGIVAFFDDEVVAEAVRAAVLADPRLKGKLSNLSIGA